MRRILIAIAALCLLAIPSWAVPSVLQHTFHLNQTTASTAQLFASPVTAGSMIWVGVISSSLATTGVTGVSDNVNGAGYTSQNVFLNGNTHINAEIWAFPNSASGTITVTVTLQASALNNVFIMEIGGLATSSPKDTTANGFLVAGTALVSGAFTTTTANEILTAVAGEYSTGGVTYAAQATWTLSDTSQFAGAMTKVVSSTQSGITATMTASSSSNGAIAVATFKAPSTTGHCASCEISDLIDPKEFNFGTWR